MLAILNSISNFFLDKHRTLSFESKILVAISVLGLSRTVFGFYQIIISQIPEVITIQTIFATLFFTAALITALHGKYTSRAAMIFSICLLVLLTRNWITVGGLEGYSEYNLMSMLIIFAAINRGKFLLTIASTVWVVEFVLVIIWHQFPELLNFDEIYPTTKIYNFQFVVGIVTILLVYLSKQYDINKVRTKHEAKMVFQKIQELEEENLRIENEKSELQNMNILLEDRVTDRTIKLTHSNETLDQYLQLSSEEIAPLVSDVVHTIKTISINTDDESLDWLKSAAHNLSTAYSKVYEK